MALDMQPSRAPARTRSVIPPRLSLAGNPLLLSAPAIGLLTLLAGSLLVLLLYSFYAFERGQVVESVTLATWLTVLQDGFFWDVLARTITLASSVTIASLAMGYPIAYGMAKVSNPLLLSILYVVFFTPLIVGIVVRSYGWIILL